MPDAADPVVAGDLVVDVGARRCAVAGQEVTLRAKEFDLLARLVTSLGVALGRETLMADVWDENWYGSTKTLDVHIAALRRQLMEAGREHRPAGPAARDHDPARLRLPDRAGGLTATGHHDDEPADQHRDGRPP